MLLAAAGLKVTACKTAQGAIEGAQIITTCTADKQYATILTDNMVGSEVLINAIGGYCPGKTELNRDILLRSDIFVEFPPRTRIEGELQQLPDDYTVEQLWKVITGKTIGRRSDNQITLFDSVGFAIEDFSSLRYIRDLIKGVNFLARLTCWLIRMIRGVYMACCKERNSEFQQSN